MSPGDVLESKYRVDAPIDGAEDAFAGTIVSGDTSLIIFKVSDVAASSIERGKSVEHMHLAKLLDVISIDGQKYAVAERAPGLTLAERLDEIGKKEPVDAVRFALRIADALSSLHEAGACHGSVHPRGILIQVEGRAAPVLGYFPSKDTSYRSAERGNEDPPSESDDAWAAAALLHKMLLGVTPPRDGYKSEDEVREAGVTDTALLGALTHALNHDPDQRSRDVRPLKRELARWFVEHAGEEPMSPGPHSTSPPPLPPSAKTLGGTTSTMSPAPSRPPTAAPPKPGMGRMLPLAVAGIVVGLLGGWVFNVMRPKPPAPVKAKVAAPAPPPSDKPVELEAVPVTGESEKAVAATDKVSSCVMGYMPKNTFGSAPDFSGMCEIVDPRAGADKLRVALVASAPKTGGATEANKIFARIGWYDMAAFAVVRAGCCPSESKPLELPAPSKGCGDMAEALRNVGQEVVSNKPAEESLKKYTAAIHCELNANHGTAFRKAERPAGGEDTAFLELVKAIQTTP